MKNLVGHILESVGGGGILGGIGEAMLDNGGEHKDANGVPHAGPSPDKPLPKYKKGTARVPKTGPAILHKDEAVLNKDDADKYRKAKGDMSEIFDLAESKLSGEKHKKHKKVVKEIRTRKAKNGGYIHEHHHTHPEDHPMEEHTSPDQDSMAAHMLDHMGTPNPGEPDGDEAAAGGGAPPAGGGAAPVPAGGAAPEAV